MNIFLLLAIIPYAAILNLIDAEGKFISTEIKGISLFFQLAMLIMGIITI